MLEDADPPVGACPIREDFTSGNTQLGSTAVQSQPYLYDPATMKHLRLARSSTGVDVIWTDDNSSFSSMHSFTMQLPALPITVALRSTFKDDSAVGQKASFDNLDACL